MVDLSIVMLVYQRVTAWWFGTFLVGGLEWNMNSIFPYVEKNHPNWRTHIFQRGRSTTNQLKKWLNEHETTKCIASQIWSNQQKDKRIITASPTTWNNQSGSKRCKIDWPFLSHTIKQQCSYWPCHYPQLHHLVRRVPNSAYFPLLLVIFHSI